MFPFIGLAISESIYNRHIYKKLSQTRAYKESFKGETQGDGKYSKNLKKIIDGGWGGPSLPYTAMFTKSTLQHYTNKGTTT